VYFYKGTGNGTFSSAGAIPIGQGATNVPVGIDEVRVGDFNGDGKTDVAVSAGLGLYVMWNTGNFTFSTMKVDSSPNGISATPVDVNQDGFTDLLVTYYSCAIGKQSAPGSCTNWKVLLGSASMTFRQSAVMNLGIDFQGLRGTTAADINGDGINDIVGISFKDGQIFNVLIWLGNADGTYNSTPLEFSLTSDAASDLVASDFNRDGRIDFAVPVSVTAGFTAMRLAVLLNATPRATCTPSTVSPSVTVCQSQDLTSSTSPVHWIAESQDSRHPVTEMQVYVDNQLVVNSPTSSPNEDLPLPTGPHLVVTKAWDNSGANFHSTQQINIYSGKPGETCPTASNSLNICSPMQNQTTPTLVHVFANSNSSAIITGVQVYIDNELVYDDASHTTYVDTAFTVTKGLHNIVIKAFDANGTILQESRTVDAQ
jgi:hypothetical protein